MGENLNQDLLPGTLYMMVLRTLNQGPLHGYAIAKRIRDWSKGDLEIEDGSLYPALNRMLIKGWLKAEWGMTDNNRRARFYQLTAAGRKQLDSESKGFDKMIHAIQMVMRTSER
jgi:PadR family transcriptional regulator, regulatory protein PadR